MVDHAFLLPPKLARPFTPRRSIDRQDYERQLDFYINSGYVDRPASFFSLPGTAPPPSIIEEKPYHDGRYQVIGYESGYVAKNPLIRDAYHAHTANRRGYLVRWFHGDRPRNTVLCHHGYMLGEPRQARKMFRVRHLFTAGLDVALFIAPFHWRRRTGSLAKRGFFLQPDNVGMTCECMGQSMHDLAIAFHILFKLNAPRVGLIGASLGGYNTALFTALSDLAAFGAMMVPAVDFSRPLGPDTARHAFPVDVALREKISQVWTLHSPLNFPSPRLAPEKLLVVASRGDQLCPFEYVRTLCDQWRITDRHFLSGGHWLVFDRKRGQAWYAFLNRMGFLESTSL
ncbi:MAG: alpha/beta hydrolase, partial [Thermodesulfobacteriota bacterium]